MRGMGQSPMFTLPRATYPTAQGQKLPARRFWLSLTPFDLAQSFAASAPAPALAATGPAAQKTGLFPRHEKQGIQGCSEGARSAPRGSAGFPYSLIHGNKSRKPHQHWLSGRFHGQNNPRERNPSGTTTRP